MKKLNCHACADFIADYLNGDLDAEVRASFETHLDRCRNCRAYLEQYAVVIKAGQQACKRENEAAAQRLARRARARHPRRAEGLRPADPSAPDRHVTKGQALVGPSSSTGPWRRAIT